MKYISVKLSGASCQVELLCGTTSGLSVITRLNPGGEVYPEYVSDVPIIIVLTKLALLETHDA